MVQCNNDWTVLYKASFLAHIAFELLPSLDVRRPLTFHILIFFSETHLSQMK
jgi:hypothetical protein